MKAFERVEAHCRVCTWFDMGVDRRIESVKKAAQRHADDRGHPVKVVVSTSRTIVPQGA